MKKILLSWRFHQWAVWLTILVIFAGVFYWGHKYTSRSSEIRIATGIREGYCHKFGKILQKHIETNTDFKVHLLSTKDSSENVSMLLSGEVDLAFLESGAVSMENLMAVSLLWYDYVQVVIRKDSSIRNINDLKGHNVVIGKSVGAKFTADRILEHFCIDSENFFNNNKTVGDMLTDTSITAAIETTNLLNKQLREIMKSGNFKLLPIEEAEGFSFHYPYYSQKIIPRGVYPSFGTPCPEKQINTITTTTILACRDNVAFDIIKTVLKILNRIDLRAEAPVLVEKKKSLEDKTWKLLPVHPAAKAHFNPHEGIVKMFSGFFEKLNQHRWWLLYLVLSFGIGLYLAVRHKKINEKKEFNQEIRKLEKWFADIIQIGKVQKEAKDMRLLKQYLNEALSIKKQAVETMLGTNIENSNMFLAFLHESSNLISEIEWKMMAAMT